MGADEYGILRDRVVPDEGAPRLELPEQFPVLSAAEVMEELFRAEDSVDSVAIVVGSDVIGGAGRGHVELVEEERAVGTGDGASLPGYSSAYELLTFLCAECGSVTYRLHVDPRDPPLCVNGHGAMDPPQ
ncbi:hypothetical protein AB0E69_19955 [Kribbella sp. NPDC026611]|uniref:hypothetical protein n=1 Tax=Kribbella sp. NPDC026611 TaxID=3154911 RepID=UPI0033EAC16C